MVHHQNFPRASVSQDSIVAEATAHGRAGVAIIRTSGPKTSHIAQSLLGLQPPVRYAHLSAFRNSNDEIIDHGLALYFKAPQSFTGEDVLELHCHGSPIVVQQLISEIVHLGARIAKPGEFSERAFLNNKLDLAQAEAIADLINSQTQQAATAAMRSLEGAFSKQVQTIHDALVHLRVYVEAALDFPDEEIDFLSEGGIAEKLDVLIQQAHELRAKAKQGALLREGLQIVIAGQPNVGKSSLLNAFAEKETAIVTDIPGTTRDILREQIQLDGIPLHIIDTAGIRESSDPVEKIGIARAWAHMKQADHILLLQDASLHHDTSAQEITRLHATLGSQIGITQIINKIDLIEQAPHIQHAPSHTTIYLSAKYGQGLDLLKQHLKHIAGWQEGEGVFSARTRHVEALRKTHEILQQGFNNLAQRNAGELLAEDLRVAQHHLAEITGNVTSDELLGRIFSSFCIGK